MQLLSSMNARTHELTVTSSQKFKDLSPKMKNTSINNGAEYTKFKEYCRHPKMKQEFTFPEKAKQNGISQRFSRTLVEILQCLLTRAKFPEKYLVKVTKILEGKDNNEENGWKKAPYCGYGYGMQMVKKTTPKK